MKNVVKQTIEQYVEATAGNYAVKRRILADLTRGGVDVTADSSEMYRKTIDTLLAKMKMKRAPLEGRVPTQYKTEHGEHDRKVVAGIDPIDGQKLEKVFISEKVEAMYNPRTHVVWPIPVANAASLNS